MKLFKERMPLMFVVFVMAALAIFFLLKGKGGKINGTQESMTPDEIKEAIDSSFSRYADNFRVINSVMDSNTVSVLLQSATDEQRAMVERLTRLQKELAANGLKMAQFVEVNQKTSRQWETVLVKLDSLQRQKLGLPPTAQSFGEYNDEWMNAVIWLDSLNTVHPSVTMKNVFDLVQYQTPDGKYWARIDNLNPYTSNEPGTNVFNLELPKPLPETPKGQKWKVGFTVQGGAVFDGGARPLVSGGVILIRQ